MKRIGTLLLAFGLAALGARAQTTGTTSTAPTTSTPVVFGHGTTNYIPIWTGGSTLGNSVLFQSGGNVGIGTTNPLFPLVVTNGTGFNSCPSEAFFETEGTDQFTAAIRALAGHQTDNLTFAIDGVTFSPGGIGVQGNHATSGGAFGGGVKGQTSATNGFNFGVWGAALGTTGSGVGVMGTTASPSANAVFGNNPNTTGGGGGVSWG
jgi:hypothetical protein